MILKHIRSRHTYMILSYDYKVCNHKMHTLRHGMMFTEIRNQKHIHKNAYKLNNMSFTEMHTYKLNYMSETHSQKSIHRNAYKLNYMSFTEMHTYKFNYMS